MGETENQFFFLWRHQGTSNKLSESTVVFENISWGNIKLLEIQDVNNFGKYGGGTETKPTIRLMNS